MSGILTTEIPSFHDSLETLTLGHGLHIDKLTDLKVSRSKVVPHRQEILLCNWEFSQMFLGREIVFEEVASLWLLELMEFLFTAANLD